MSELGEFLMTSVRLLLGHPGDGRRERLLQEALRANSLWRDWIFCVPGKSAVRQIERAAEREAGLLGRPAATLEGLAEMVLAGVPPRRAAASSAVEGVLLEESMRALEWMEAGAKDFRSRMDETFRTWAHNGLWNEEDMKLHCRSKGVPPSGFDLRLFTLYGAFRGRLDAACLADEPMRLRLAAEVLESESAIPPFRRLYVDGFYDLTPLERRFLAALCAGMDEVHVSLDWHKDMREEIRTLPEATLAFWRGLGQRLGGIEEKAETPAAADGRRSVMNGFFPPEPESPRGPSDAVEVFIAGDLRAELEAMAARLARAHHEEGIDWEDMAVFFRDADAAMPLAMEIFRGYGIPLASPWGTPLAREPLVAGIGAFFRFHETGLAADFLDALASPLLRPKGLDFSAVQRALAKEGWTQGGLEEALAALRRREERLRFTAERAAEDADSADKAESLLGEAERLNASLRALAPWGEAAQLVPAADGETEGPAFREAILKALDRLGLRESSGMQEEPRQAWKGFEKTLDELCGAWRLAGRKMPWKAAMEELMEALSTARMPGTAEQDGVLAGRMLEMRGVRCRVLAAGGLMEGHYPASQDDGLFGSRGLRGSLHRIEPRLESWLHFHMLLNLPEQHVFLSAHENEFKDLRRAPFLAELEKLLPDKAEKKEPDVFYSPTAFAEAVSRKAKEALLDGDPLPRLEMPEDWKLGDLQALVHSTWLLLWREQGNTLNAWDGVLTRPETLDIVKAWAEKQNEKGFSPSQMETYADCNFKYFAERVLELEEMEEPSEEVSVLERGLLIHAVLAKFYAGRRNGKLSEAERDAALAELKAIAAGELKRFPGTLPWRVFAEQLPVLWEAFVDAEIKDKSGFVPHLLEASFGVPSKEGGDTLMEAPLEVDGIKIRGRIDRIDRNPETGEYRVFDYKSSAPKNRFTQYRNGHLLQLPLYLLALRAAMGKGRDVGAGLYFVNPSKSEVKVDSRYASKPKAIESLRGNNRITKIFLEDSDYESALHLMKERMAAVICALEGGRFPVKFGYAGEAGESCGYCAYASICQKNERRMTELWKTGLPAWKKDFYWPGEGDEKAEDGTVGLSGSSGESPRKPSFSKAKVRKKR
jgi:ATP-dependent helicase/nuclease subunit B